MTKRQTPRWGWALTGSGHFLKESLALIRELEHVDLFVSKAGAEVLRMYKQELALPRETRVYRDTSASSVTVGQFYYGVYHTLIVAPATSNAVAKFVYGISDDLISNVFAQSGKCRVVVVAWRRRGGPGRGEERQVVDQLARRRHAILGFELRQNELGALDHACR